MRLIKSFLHPAFQRKMLRYHLCLSSIIAYLKAYEDISQHLKMYPVFVQQRSLILQHVCQIIGNIPLVSKNNVCCFFRYILISAGICLGPHSFHSVFGFSRHIQWNGGTWYLWLPGAVALYSHCNYNSILPLLFLATEYWLGGYCPLLEEQITCRSHTC